MRLLSRNKTLCAFLFLGSVSGSAAYAQDINELRPLAFGDIAIHSYSSVARITIEIGGSYSTNANVSVLSQPSQGEYEVVGGPPNSTYSIILPSSVNLNGPGGAYFTLDNLEVRPTTLITDGSGNDTFFMTGRLQTQGGGMTYLDGSYSGDITVTVNF